jgi:hypothetical protein
VKYESYLIELLIIKIIFYYRRFLIFLLKRKSNIRREDPTIFQMKFVVTMELIVYG